MAKSCSAHIVVLPVVLLLASCTLCETPGSASEPEVQFIYPTPCEIYAKFGGLKGWRIRKVRIKGLAGFFEVDDLHSSDPTKSLIHVSDEECEVVDESRFLDYLRGEEFNVTRSNVGPLIRLYLECYYYLSVENLTVESDNKDCFIVRVLFVRSPPYRELGYVVVCGKGKSLQFQRLPCDSDVVCKK